MQNSQSEREAVTRSNTRADKVSELCMVLGGLFSTDILSPRTGIRPYYPYMAPHPEKNILAENTYNKFKLIRYSCTHNPIFVSHAEM